MIECGSEIKCMIYQRHVTRSLNWMFWTFVAVSASLYIFFCFLEICSLMNVWIKNHGQGINVRKTVEYQPIQPSVLILTACFYQQVILTSKMHLLCLAFRHSFPEL